MTDQPIPDRSEELAAPPKLGSEDVSPATGTSDPETSEAGSGSSSSEQDGAAPAGDAPKPSPDI